jgi:hypothetical protein
MPNIYLLAFVLLLWSTSQLKRYLKVPLKGK